MGRSTREPLIGPADVSEALTRIFTQLPVRKITAQLEEERRRRLLLMRIGIPAILLFFVLGLAYQDSGSNYYLLVLAIPTVLLLRHFSLNDLNVTLGAEDPRSFAAAAGKFRVQRSVLNDVTGDRIRILLRHKYRHVKWPVTVLVLEQRWKKESGHFFLMIGPEFHWWSGGSIWFPWHWKCGKNDDLEFSRAGDSCITLHFEEGLTWRLRFMGAAAREQAYEALAAIRQDAERPTRKPHASKPAPPPPPPLPPSPPAGKDPPWHEVLGVAANASREEITAAHRNAIRKCHPDTVADRSELIRRAAATEAEQINVAYDRARAARGF